MQLPGKKWLFLIGLIVILVIVLLSGITVSHGRSVSNLYIIPAGVFNPYQVLSSLHPETPSPAMTPAGTVPTATTPASPSWPAAPETVIPVTTTNVPDTLPASRSTLDVLRGDPYTINGTVDNSSVTMVQVWLLDGNISTTMIPVMQNVTFQVTLDPDETEALSRSFTTAVLAQYPLPSGHFAVMRNASGDIIETESGQTTRILSRVRDPGSYPTTQVDYLDQGIRAAGNSARIYFLNGVDGWITIDAVGPAKPGTLVVRGTTSLPVGSSLSISVGTVNTHPTPKNYDWSHEIAEEVTASVMHGPGDTNRYSGLDDTSGLNTGKYFLRVESRDENLQANAEQIIELIAKTSASPGTGNYIDWSRLALPKLVVNTTIAPVMLAGELRIVPPGTGVSNNEVPYGSIIDCGPDGICRIYNGSGVQTLAVYYSNEARIMQVPNGAMIDSGTVGNVTFIRLDGEVILTKIDEFPQNS